MKCPSCKAELALELAIPTAEDKPITTLERIALQAEAEPLGVGLNSELGVNSYVWKTYVAPLLPAMQKLGHIGKDYTYLSTCAATVYSILLKAGIELPPIPKDPETGKEYWASMALVEAMEWFAKKSGCYVRQSRVRPLRGYVVFFDWDGDKWEDHVGIVLGFDKNGLKTFEGNRGNKTVVGYRKWEHVTGFADFTRFDPQTELE